MANLGAPAVPTVTFGGLPRGQRENQADRYERPFTTTR